MAGATSSEGFQILTALYLDSSYCHGQTIDTWRAIAAPQRTKLCRYKWHSAGSLGWPFPMLKYKHIFQIKYMEAVLSNSTRKLLWFEITKMLIAVKQNKFIVLFIIIFGTLSFPIVSPTCVISTAGRRFLTWNFVIRVCVLWVNLKFYYLLCWLMLAFAGKHAIFYLQRRHNIVKQ